MDVGRLLDDLRRRPPYRSQIVHDEPFPARPARYRPPTRPLAAPLAEALERKVSTASS